MGRRLLADTLGYCSWNFSLDYIVKLSFWVFNKIFLNDSESSMTIKATFRPADVGVVQIVVKTFAMT